MDIERERCVKAFNELGMKNANDFLGVYGQKGDFLALERGDIDAEEFRRRIRPLFDTPVTDTQIDEAFCRFLIGIPRHRLEALRELRKHYGVYLLSNTNPIMMESFIAEQFRQEGLEMNDYFDGMVMSYKAKCYKPDREIFDYTAMHCGINPADTLFLDDSQANVEAGIRAGYQGARVAPGREFMDVIRETNF